MPHPCLASARRLHDVLLPLYALACTSVSVCLHQLDSAGADSSALHMGSCLSAMTSCVDCMEVSETHQIAHGTTWHLVPGWALCAEWSPPTDPCASWPAEDSCPISAPLRSNSNWPECQIMLAMPGKTAQSLPEHLVARVSWFPIRWSTVVPKLHWQGCCDFPATFAAAEAGSACWGGHFLWDLSCVSQSGLHRICGHGLYAA